MPHLLTDKEYLNQLKIQFSFLQSDLKEYELGKKDFAIKIATTLRTIFHKTGSSNPILPDLAERNGIKIYFKGKRVDIDEYVVLYIGFTIGNKIPSLDAPFLLNKTFSEYWNEIVYAEGKVRYTRKQLVLWAANKLGGAHVDPEIPDNLFHIINGSVKLISKNFGEEIIINQVVYEMALQVIKILDDLIPKLENILK